MNNFTYEKTDAHNCSFFNLYLSCFWKFQSLKFSDLRKMFLCSQAGVGKTSIALGLAQLIAEGKVPLNLQVWKHSKHGEILWSCSTPEKICVSKILVKFLFQNLLEIF